MTDRPTDIHAALIGLFEQAGFARVDIPILQPASLFLDLSGEDIRRRLFITQDGLGGEHCLRPEYTIPVCRQHVALGRGRADYSYLGPVFRQRPNESGEFLQAGIESIGRPDVDRADADVLATALDGLRLFPTGDLAVRIGDVGLIEALFGALDVPAPAQRRLVRRLASGEGAGALDAEAASGDSRYAGLLAAIEGQDPRAARAFVEDVMAIAGISTVGGRSAGEIADRFLSRAANRSGTLSETARSALADFLAIEGPATDVPLALDDLGRSGSLGIGGAVERFRKRLDAMAARGIDLARLRFSADFIRSLDYYTGFVFEVGDAARPERRHLAAGGRYDRLLQHLGASGPVPAVGCSFWLDRLDPQP